MRANGSLAAQFPIFWDRRTRRRKLHHQLVRRRSAMFVRLCAGSLVGGFALECPWIIIRGHDRSPVNQTRRRLPSSFRFIADLTCRVSVHDGTSIHHCDVHTNLWWLRFPPFLPRFFPVLLLRQCGLRFCEWHNNVYVFTRVSIIEAPVWNYYVACF